MALEDSPLGKTVAYEEQYDSSLLFAIARNQCCEKIELGQYTPPFLGEDVWTAYEVSWLNLKGKPCYAIIEFRISAHSPFLIESKSFKLYLNSFNQTMLLDVAALQKMLERDLSQAVGDQVKVQVFSESQYPIIDEPEAILLDTLDIDCNQYQPCPQLLALNIFEVVVEERLKTRLLRSLCPVTGQPDWATLYIEYRGHPFDHASILKYIVSFRSHGAFHEHCVERLYRDIWQYLHPESLTLYARYTRRGGLEINPFRSSIQKTAPRWRSPAQ